MKLVGRSERPFQNVVVVVVDFVVTIFYEIKSAGVDQLAKSCSVARSSSQLEDERATRALC